MFFSALLVLVGFGSFGSVSGSPAVDEAYRAVVSLVSPGQQHLTGDSLRSLFNTLEKRVQCGGVSCEKVSFIRLSSAARLESQVSDCRGCGERSRSKSY